MSDGSVVFVHYEKEEIKVVYGTAATHRFITNLGSGAGFRHLFNGLLCLNVLRLTNINVVLGQLCGPTCAILLGGEHGTFSHDAQCRVAVLDGAAEYFLFVEETGWGVLHICRMDKPGTMEKSIATEKQRPNLQVWQLQEKNACLKLLKKILFLKNNIKPLQFLILDIYHKC